LEYYSVLYNLGVIYSLLGRCVESENSEFDENKHKEAIKNFQYSSWIFDKIKNEINTHLSHKEISNDMSSNNLSFVNIKSFNLLLIC